MSAIRSYLFRLLGNHLDISHRYFGKGEGCHAQIWMERPKCDGRIFFSNLPLYLLVYVW